MADTPGGLRRELKRAVLCMSRQLVLDSHAKRQEDAMYYCVYGNEEAGTESMAQAMLDGTGVWSGLYDELLLINSVDPNSQTQTKRLVVKSVLWPASKGKQFIVGQGGLTFEGIFLKTKADANPEDNVDPKYFSAKTLQGEAQLTVSSCRTATEIATKKFLREDGEYPPGKSFQDMLLFVRQQCYLTFLGGLNEERLEYRRARLSMPMTDPEQMPHNYYFTGMIAFCLFGPKPLSGKYLNIFNPEVESVMGQPITSSIRAENKAKFTDGRIKPKISRLNRLQKMGLGVKDLVQAAQLEQIRTANRHKVLTDLMQASNAEVQSLIAQKKTLVEQIQAYNQVPALKTRCAQLSDKLDALDEEIEIQRKRGSEWLDELDEDRKNAPKRAFQKCMKSIGCEEEPEQFVLVLGDNEPQESGETEDTI
mmetsp:Transcript_70998/g.199166  ORF Transcript_70998/g.199166 Transcript_70998/m.199166 type:complete len:422 (-) Transcript_70998:73-1338(-)